MDALGHNLGRAIGAGGGDPLRLLVAHNRTAPHAVAVTPPVGSHKLGPPVNASEAGPGVPDTVGAGDAGAAGGEGDGGDGGGSGMLVRIVDAVGAPAQSLFGMTVAVACQSPAVWFAERVGAGAEPVEPVAVTADRFPVKVPEGPEVGVAKVTCAVASGLVPAATVATSWPPNACPTDAEFVDALRWIAHGGSGNGGVGACTTIDTGWLEPCSPEVVSVTVASISNFPGGNVTCHGVVGAGAESSEPVPEKAPLVSSGGAANVPLPTLQGCPVSRLVHDQWKTADQLSGPASPTKPDIEGLKFTGPVLAPAPNVTEVTEAESCTCGGRGGANTKDIGAIPQELWAVPRLMHHTAEGAHASSPNVPVEGGVKAFHFVPSRVSAEGGSTPSATQNVAEEHDTEVPWELESCVASVHDVPD